MNKVSYEDFDKMSKVFAFGDKEFGISMNRKMAYDEFNKHTDYLATAVEINNLTEKVSKKELSAKEYSEYTMLMQKEKLINETLVNECLPSMLEYYGKNILPDGIATYDEYAQNILNYCYTYGILYDYEDEETGEQISGFYTIVSTFIAEAFMQGVRTPSKKPAMKITTK